MMIAIRLGPFQVASIAVAMASDRHPDFSLAVTGGIDEDVGRSRPDIRAEVDTARGVLP
jgi:hypothetical protein